MADIKIIQKYLNKWQEILRLQDWDIRLTVVDTPWRKTGDIKIDDDDRNAVLMINSANPKKGNIEEVVIHELLHLRLWAMDQMIEHLLLTVFGEDEDDPKHQFAYRQYMGVVESTTENLTKAFLSIAGDNKEISFGRVQQQVDEELNKARKNQR
jgi:hypothetical protein